MADDKVQIIDDEEIITLFDEDDNPMDFYEVAVVEYEGELYALLQPADVLADGILAHAHRLPNCFDAGPALMRLAILTPFQETIHR